MTLEQQTADFIKGFEGYSATAYWDVNAYRIGYGSDTITTNSNGAYRKVVKGDLTTQQMAELDLARRIKNEFQPRVISQVGSNIFNQLPDETKIALTSVAYNYGSLPSTVRDAALTGDSTKIADAIKNHAQDNHGVNAGRRNAEANFILTALQYVKQKVTKTVDAAQSHKAIAIVVIATGLLLTTLLFIRLNRRVRV